VLDHRGEAKLAFAHLARALAPVAVWTTDEGLGGVDVHVANDRPDALAARLRVALYRELELAVDETVLDLQVEAHGALTYGVEALLGRFADVSWAYRFGPPAQDLIAVSLEAPTGALLSQAFRFPAGRPLTRVPATDLGLEAVLEVAPAGGRVMRISTRRFAYGVRVALPGYTASDDGFGVEPGHTRAILLSPVEDGDRGDAGGFAELTALNLAGSVRAPLQAALRPSIGPKG
jgi:beta-mannosidase